MSGIGGKADMTICGGACLLLRSLLGLKRTCSFALHMSACDPKRTLLNDRQVWARVCHAHCIRESCYARCGSKSRVALQR
jgi:hypothetical protein